MHIQKEIGIHNSLNQENKKESNLEDFIIRIKHIYLRTIERKNKSTWEKQKKEQSKEEI